MVCTPRKIRKGESESPSKQQKQQQQQQRSVSRNLHPSQLDPYDSPSSIRRLFSPRTHRQQCSSPLPLKNAIGPTPQRDGRVLGLFDLVSESGGSPTTPTGRKKSIPVPARGSGDMDTIEKQEGEEGEEGDASDNSGVRSPASYSLANLFATPTTLRYAALVDDDSVPVRGPSNIDNVRDAEGARNTPTHSANETPPFLRRYNSAASSHGDLIVSPTAVRKPTKFAGRGLSALVKGLREMEKERTQDDWDVLNEIEAEQQQDQAGNVQVCDSQTAVNASPPRRSWKKKGQKRTTRRVKMKPVVSKPKEMAVMNVDENDDEEDDDDDERVPETQPHNGAPGSPARGITEPESRDQPGDSVSSDLDSLLGNLSDLGSDSGSDEEFTINGKQKAPASSSNPGPNACEGKLPKKQSTKEKAEDNKPRGRKVNPEAHANYRSLKIRSKGSRKTGSARFRRR